MRLPKGGLVYGMLIWYGYPGWRLEDTGVSICKIFWSIILGLPFVIVGRLLARWGGWVTSDYEDEDTEKLLLLPVLKTLTLPLVLVVLTGVVAKLIFGTYFALWWLWPFFVWIALAGFVLFIMFLYKTSEFAKHSKSVGEVAQIIRGGFHSIKHTVCPTIRFEKRPSV